MARRFGVPGAAADAVTEDVASRDGGRDLLFRSCVAAGGAALEAPAPVTAALLARAWVGVVRLVAVDVVVEPADVGRITTMELGRVADDSGGYLCASFLAGGPIAVCCSWAVVAGFFPSDTDRLGGGADEEALDDALPGLLTLPLVDRGPPAAAAADDAVVVVVIVVVDDAELVFGRMAGFVGSRLGEMLRLGSWLPTPSLSRSLGGRAVGPAGLRSERARVSDDISAASEAFGELRGNNRWFGIWELGSRCCLLSV
ncbi:hypothetical protein PWT90_03170 [Aphanocladium album]|nr:hypothetical protein PWT90_03170 [Aphanocladium album]